jgi:hypothetical protein
MDEPVHLVSSTVRQTLTSRQHYSLDPCSEGMTADSTCMYRACDMCLIITAKSYYAFRYFCLRVLNFDLHELGTSPEFNQTRQARSHRNRSHYFAGGRSCLAAPGSFWSEDIQPAVLQEWQSDGSEYLRAPHSAWPPQRHAQATRWSLCVYRVQK